MQSYNSKKSSPKVQKKKLAYDKTTYVSCYDKAKIEFEKNQQPIPDIVEYTKVRESAVVFKEFENIHGDKIVFLQPVSICSKIAEKHHVKNNNVINTSFVIFKNDILMFNGELFMINWLRTAQFDNPSAKLTFELQSLSRSFLRDDVTITADMNHFVIGEYFHSNNVIAGYLVEISKLKKIVDIRTMEEPACIIKNSNDNSFRYYDVKKSVVVNNKIIFRNDKQFVYLDCVTMESSSFSEVITTNNDIQEQNNDCTTFEIKKSEQENIIDVVTNNHEIKDVMRQQYLTNNEITQQITTYTEK